MYILFINSGGKCDIYFSNQFNNNSNKKKIVQPMGSTRPMWVGLDLCDELGWVEFFLTHHCRLGQKMPLTRPMHTPT